MLEFRGFFNKKNPSFTRTGMILALFCVMLAFPVVGQEIRYGNAWVNADGSTTFRYESENAKNVKIIFDGRLRRETSVIKGERYHKARMKKDSTGVWVYHTPPLADEVYTYMFEVDGKRVYDPLNPDSVRVHCNKMSTFIVSGTPQTKLYTSKPLHGRVDTLAFESPTGGKSRGVLVYLPPQYSKDQRDYPVLYLLHGLNGDEFSWTERGRAVDILDNLIVLGRVTPMIMVLPDANPEVLIDRKMEVKLIKNIFLYPSWNEGQFEKCYMSLDSFLSEKYRFSKLPGHRAVAGLSAGAKQSANLANQYDSTFSAVGLFSPVVGRKQLPNNTYSKYWIGGGQGDLFHHRINKFRKRMQRRHIPYTMYNSIGGHTWRNWRVYFTEFSQTLFR
jgi:enterochelin esterase family protein